MAKQDESLTSFRHDEFQRKASACTTVSFRSPSLAKIEVCSCSQAARTSWSRGNAGDKSPISRHQSPRHPPLLHLGFQRTRQFLDLGRELIEYVQQILASSAGSGRQHQRLEFTATCWSPERLLGSQTFVQCYHMQVIHHASAHLNQPMAMPQ